MNVIKIRVCETDRGRYRPFQLLLIFFVCSRMQTKRVGLGTRRSIFEEQYFKYT